MHDHDELKRLADRIAAIVGHDGLDDDELEAIEAELRTLAAQSATPAARAVAELDYVPGLLDQTCPPKIWLQIDTMGDNEDRSEAMPESAWGDLSWCYEPIGGQEVVYIRADLAGPQHSDQQYLELPACLVRSHPDHGKPAPQHAGPAVDDAMVRSVAIAINAAWTGQDNPAKAWKALGSNERKHKDKVAHAAIAALTPPKTQEPQ